MINKITILLIISAMFLLPGCCLDNPTDNGIKPIAGISLIYEQDGEEDVKVFTSAMPQPNSIMGFEAFIPNNTPYTIVLTGNDEGGVSSMKLSSTEFENNSDMTITRPNYTIASKDFSSCIKKIRVFRYESEEHNNKRIWYELTVTDIAGLKSGVNFIVVPEEGNGDTVIPDCSNTGTISKWLNWNNDLYHARWSNSLNSTDLYNYCKGVKIKKLRFSIFTECDKITSLEWHVRIGDEQYDGLSDQSSDDPKRVTIELDLLVPLDEYPIEVWSDQFVLSDYTAPNCGTDKLPEILIYLDISP